MPISRVTIFHTSDEHGRIENAARIAHMVKAAEARYPGSVLPCTSGDYFSGSAVSQLLGPGPSRAVLGASGYRYGTLGNHDVDLGEAFTRQWVNQGNMQMLTANIVDGHTGRLLPGCKAYDVASVNGARLGLFGLTTPDTPTVAFPGIVGRIKFTDPVQAGREAVEALRAQGVNVLVNLSHLGDGDADLAEQVPGIQILGGHTHQAWEAPKVVNGVPIYHSGAYRQSVTRLDLAIDTQTQTLVQHQSRLIRIHPDDPEDPEVASIVNRHLQEAKARTETVVGHLDRALKFVDGQTHDLDRVLAQAMLHKTGAELALINHDFFRQGMSAGVVTVGHVLDTMPFPDRVRVAQLSAGEVNRALLLSDRRQDKTSLWMAGRDNRYVAKDGHLFDTKTRQPVPADRRLSVAAPDFLLSGGLSYFTLPPSAEPPGQLVRDVFVDALKGHPA